MLESNFVEVPKKYGGVADFAVRIFGEDFEPVYSNGDYLLVQRADSLRHGDLGLFVIGGAAFPLWHYSKNGVARLIPITMEKTGCLWGPTVKCKGRVLGRI